MLKAKFSKRGIHELSPNITANSFQTVGMLIVQHQSQALKVLKHFILILQEEDLRVMGIVINDNNIPLASHEANPRRTDNVHIKYLFRVLNHHGVNWRMRKQ
jgi:hypothetical protein